MNILFIAPTPVFADRGCHVRIIEEAKALKRLGNNITICTYHHGNNVPGLDIKRTIKIPWYNKLDAGPSYHKFLLDFLLFLKVLRLIKNKKFDIIHAHMHESALIANFVNRFSSRKIPVVFDIQGSMSKEAVEHKFTKENTLMHKFLSKIEHHVSRVSHTIIVSSRPMAEMLKKEHKLNDEKIEVVSDGVNTDVFKPCLKIKSLVKKLKLQNKKIVVFTGLLNEYQGVDILLKAIKEIGRKDIHFLIIGYPNEEHYKKIAENLKISQFITFAGKISYLKISQYLSLADIAVSPKLPRAGEANLKLYTFMAAGLPTIVFDHPVNKEILGDLGIYAKYNDYKSLAINITRLMDNSTLRNRLSKDLRKKSLEHSWEKSAKDIVEIYKRVVRGKKSGI